MTVDTEMPDLLIRPVQPSASNGAELLADFAPDTSSPMACESVVSRICRAIGVCVCGWLRDRTCLCGCGQEPQGVDSCFLPGHDMKLRGTWKLIAACGLADLTPSSIQGAFLRCKYCLVLILRKRNRGGVCRMCRERR